MQSKSFDILTVNETRLDNPRADGAKRRARVLIPPGYLHPGKRKHQRSLKFTNDRGRGSLCVGDYPH
jgi:hypothetical protein